MSRRQLTGQSRRDSSLSGGDTRSIRSTEASADSTYASHARSDADDWHGLKFVNYELLGEVARGGMGVVYRARQTKADRIVALKLIRGGGGGPAALSRFESEARSAARLDHPGIVPIYDVGQENGIPFFTMKLVEGESLSGKIRGGPIASESAARITMQVAQAIAHAHEHGVIHRDLKPGNVLMEDGRPLVTDFGLAKVTDFDSELTRTGAAIGTPAYMPPEQARGDRDQVDEKSDVYSLGALLYSCLTGRPPFQAATSMATLLAVLNDQPVAPSLLNREVPKDLQLICLKALEKSPSDRYRSALHLAEDLRRHLDGEPIEARPASRFERAVKWGRRNPARLVAGVAAVCALLASSWGTLSNVWVKQSRDAQLEAKLLNKSLQKSKEIKQPEVAIQVPTYRDEYPLRIAFAASSFFSNDLISARSVLEQIGTENVGLEYHLVQRMLNEQRRSLELGSPYHLESIDSFGDDQLAVTLRQGTLQTLFLDSETLEVELVSPNNLREKAFLDAPLYYGIGQRRDLEVWDTRSPTQVGKRVIEGWDFGPIAVVDLSKRLFATSRGRAVVFRDMDTKREVAQSGLPSTETCSLWDGESGRLFVGTGGWGEDATVCIFDSKDWTKTPAMISLDDPSPIASMALTPRASPSEADRLLVGLGSRQVGWLDLSEPFEFHPLVRSPGRVLSVASDPRGRHVAIGTEKGRLLVFDTLVRRFRQILAAHSGRCSAVHFSDDGRFVYTCGGFDGCVKQFDLLTIDRLTALPKVDNRSDFLDVAFDRSGKWMISIDGTRDETGLLFWRRDNLEAPIRFDAQAFDRAKRSPPRWCDFLDEETAVIVHQNGIVQLYAPSSQQSLGLVETGVSAFVRSSVSMSPSRRFLSVAQKDGRISVVDLDARKIVSQFTAKLEYFQTATLMSDNELIIAGDNETWVADLNGMRLRNLHVSERYFGFEMAPDREAVVGRGHWGRVMVLDPVTGAERWSRQFDFDVRFQRFSSDSRRVFVGGGDHGLLILDAQDGSTLLNLIDLEDVRAIAIAPNNEELVFATHSILHRRITKPLPDAIGQKAPVRTLYD